MKVVKLVQLSESEIGNTNFDLFITASGYESRAIHIAERLQPTAENKICFSFKNYEDSLARKKNDRYFRNQEFRKFIFFADDESAILEWIKTFVEKLEAPAISILVDYSCMTRVWYSALLLFFRHYTNDRIKQVFLTFSYSLAKFSPPSKSDSRNVHVGPIKGFSTISPPIRPTALIIGLGYIPQRAAGLVEYFDAVPFLFYTDSSGDNIFASEVEKNNADLLAQVPVDNIYKYTLTEMLNAFYQLSDLCKDLKSKYRVVLAPCGPKPFSLICLLTGAFVDNLDVWRISAGEKEKPVDRLADGRVTSLQLVLSNK